MRMKNKQSQYWHSETPSSCCHEIWHMNVLTKDGFILCDRCLEQARNQAKLCTSHGPVKTHECPIHSAIYDPSRARYPYISAELQCLWHTALSQHADPVSAWKSIQEDEAKRAQYIAGRGQKNFVRSAWSDALCLCAAALLHTSYAHGPEYVLGHAPHSAQSVISHVAGSRFLHLLGATCMQEKLDFASWSMLSTASDWFELPQRQSQETHNSTHSTIKTPRVLLSWTSEALHFEDMVQKSVNNTTMLDLHIGATYQLNADAMVCDVVLPSAHVFEFQDISVSLNRHYKQVHRTFNEEASLHLKSIRTTKYPAMLQPQWESKSPWMLFQEFASTLSALGEKYPINDDKIHELVDIYNKYSLLGPYTVQENIHHQQYDLWNYARKYEILKAQLGTKHHISTSHSMPKVTNCQDACSIMFFLQ